MSDEPKLTGVLQAIVERKQRENVRRRAHVQSYRGDVEDRAAVAYEALRRPSGGAPRVIAEVKFRSPSAGEIRRWSKGEPTRVACAYEAEGAAAISVLVDRRGFGGTPLDVRRVAACTRVPVLFKEFVLEEQQIDLARALGASMVLLLVRVLAQSRLKNLVRAVEARGMAPVVEAADADELERALATNARIVGMNARDLRTFGVDKDRAERYIAATPSDRIAVFMSGVRSAADYQAVARGRADAVLVGEGLMRPADPGRALKELTGR